ncbi:MAG: CHASE2 domain-containing protein [Parvibaculales bacterium]
MRLSNFLSLLRFGKASPVILPSLLLVFCVYALLSRPPLVEDLQNRVFDQYNRWQPRTVADSPVVFVDIDEASLEKVGQFPWPRSIFADLVEAATRSGAAAIALDVLFPEADRNGPDAILPVWEGLRKDMDSAEWSALSGTLERSIENPDDRFAAVLSRTPTVVAMMLNREGTGLPAPKVGFAVRKSGAAGTDETEAMDPLAPVPSSAAAIFNIEPIQNAAVAQGTINARLDPDGIIRRTPLLLRGAETLYPSLGIEVLRIAQGAGSIALKASDVRGEASFSSGLGLSRMKVGNFIVPLEADGSMRLYYAPADSIDKISAWELLSQEFDPARISGRIAFVGTSAAGLKDLRATPIDPVMAGVQVHIQAVQQIIDGVYLRRPLWLQTLEPLSTLGFGLVLIFLAARYGVTRAVVVLMAGIASLLYASWWAFSQHLHLLDPVLPSLAISASFLLAGFLNYLGTERERREVRLAFGQYLSPELVEQIAQEPDALQLGGEVKPVTVMFSDIRGFTNISERFKDHPHLLTHIINRFLTDFSQSIQDKSGTIDKYIGDCIMAFWNAPTELENHPRFACLAALDMQNSLSRLNAELRDDAELHGMWDGELKIGIGLNTGACLVGNVGSAQRFNYSVMGDPVNIASRLEGQTKNYGTTILVGSQTRDGAPDLAFLEMDLISLKGKDQSEQIFVLLGDDTYADSSTFKTIENRHKGMLAAYRAQDWASALDMLSELEKVCPELVDCYNLYRTRIEAFQTSPPGPDWDGVFRATEK